MTKTINPLPAGNMVDKGIVQCRICIKGIIQHDPCAKNASNQSRGTFGANKDGGVH